MAQRHGIDGALYAVNTIDGTTANVTKIARTNNWEITKGKDLVRIVNHGDSYAHRLGGVRDWSATVDLNLETSGSQSILFNRLFGASARPTMCVAFYVGNTGPNGGATMPRFEGLAWVEQEVFSSPSEDAQTLSVTLQGEGTLTYFNGTL